MKCDVCMYMLCLCVLLFQVWKVHLLGLVWTLKVFKWSFVWVMFFLLSWFVIHSFRMETGFVCFLSIFFLKKKLVSAVLLRQVTRKKITKFLPNTAVNT